MLYKPSKSKESTKWDHEEVMKNDKERLEKKWRMNVKIAGACVEFKVELFQMLYDFELMWDGHLGQSDVVNLQIDIFSSDAKPIYSELYRPGQNDRKFEKNGIKRMLLEGVVKPVQNEWAAIKVFERK